MWWSSPGWDILWPRIPFSICSWLLLWENPNPPGQASCNTCTIISDLVSSLNIQGQLLCFTHPVQSQRSGCFHADVALEAMLTMSSLLLWKLVSVSNSLGCRHPMQLRRGELALHVYTLQPDIENQIAAFLKDPSTVRRQQVGKQG